MQTQLFSHPDYLKSLSRHTLGRAQRFGLLIERYILSELKERNYSGELLSDFSAAYDIQLDSGLPIEVKAAKQTNNTDGRQRYQFCTQNGLDYLKVDFIYILCCVDQNGELFTFIIPSAHIAGRRMISITSHPSIYRGQWKQYLNAWHYLETVNAWRCKYQQIAAGQLSIFDGVMQ